MSAVTIFIKNTVYQSANDFLLRVIAAVSGIIIIRLLTKGDYGLLALIMAIVAFANLISHLGYPTMLIKSLSQFYSDEPAKASSYCRFIFKIYAFITLAFSIALYFLAPLLSRAYGVSHAADTMRFSVFLFMMMSLFTFFNWTFVGINQLKPFVLKICLPKEILTLVIVIGLLYAGWGVAGVVAAHTIGASVGVILAMAMVSEKLRGRGEIDRRWIVRGAMEMTPASLAYASTAYMDILIIGLLLTTQSVASYRACLAIVMIAVGFFPIGTFILPTFNQLARERAAVLLGEIVRMTAIIAIPAMVLVGSFSREIIAILLGSKYAESSSILALFAFVMLGHFLSSVFDQTLAYLGRFKQVSKIWVLMAVVYAALLVLFIDAVGIAGAVIASIAFRYALSFLMGFDISRHGMPIGFKGVAEILLIGCTLLANLFLIGQGCLAARAAVFAATLAIYLVLLKARRVFAGFEMLGEVWRR